MTHLDEELKQLKSELTSMWDLVIQQLKKTQEAQLNFDKDLAREVIFNEKRVNAHELTLDRDCENIFALFNPVAVDLRFVLAVLKINSNLERVGDIAEGISRYVLEVETPFNVYLMKELQLIEMYDAANSMLSDVLEAFEKEDTKLARSVFKKDELLDKINNKINNVATNYILNNNTDKSKISQCLYVLTIIKRLERIGDQTKNIAEEIIFYIEAKVLKHKGRNKKNT